MAAEVAFGGVASLLLATAAMLAAAKSHGRQLRLERELAGYGEVRFGSGANPSWVEALWRRDRVRFWSAFAVFAIFAVAQGLAEPASVPVPLRAPGETSAWLAVLTLLAWAGTGAFGVAGLSSAARFARALGAPAREGEGTLRDEAARARPAWLAGAVGGSWGWWGLVGAASLAWWALALR
jgi:hypothetical protein